MHFLPFSYLYVSCIEAGKHFETSGFRSFLLALAYCLYFFIFMYFCNFCTGIVFVRVVSLPKNLWTQTNLLRICVEIWIIRNNWTT
jgi:hypothetical protein